jgi:uncharacterized protein
MGNKIVHAEVVGKDGPALQKFWGDLFGWKQNTDLPGGYAMTDAADSGIVLGTGPAPDGGAGWVTFYVTVDDLDAALDRATSLGGAVVAPKFSPAPDTWLALVADPEGHIVGLSQAA